MITSVLDEKQRIDIGAGLKEDNPVTCLGKTSEDDPSAEKPVYWTDVPFSFSGPRGIPDESAL